MAPLVQSLYIALTAVSAICFLIGFSTSGIASFSALIVAYCFLIILILFILLNLLQKSNGANKSMFQAILYLFNRLGPLILMLGTIGFLMYLLIYYKTPILAGQVAPSYSNFNNAALGFILLQLFILYKSIDSEQYQQTGKISPITTSLLFLFSVCTLICSLIIYTILNYFRTDG